MHYEQYLIFVNASAILCAEKLCQRLTKGKGTFGGSILSHCQWGRGSGLRHATDTCSRFCSVRTCINSSKLSGSLEYRAVVASCNTLHTWLRLMAVAGKPRPRFKGSLSPALAPVVVAAAALLAFASALAAVACDAMLRVYHSATCLCTCRVLTPQDALNNSLLAPPNHMDTWPKVHLQQSPGSKQIVGSFD